MYALTSVNHTTLQAYVFTNRTYHMNTLPALVQFLHRACFIPGVDTWCKAIDTGYFTTFTCLTYRLVRKQHRKSNETDKDHLRLSHQHVRSTSSQPSMTLPPPTPYTNL